MKKERTTTQTGLIKLDDHVSKKQQPTNPNQYTSFLSIIQMCGFNFASITNSNIFEIAFQTTKNCKKKQKQKQIFYWPVENSIE